MFRRKVTFYVTDQELEAAFPKLVKAEINFSVQYVDNNKKESYAVSSDYELNSVIARILYGSVLPLRG